MTEIDLKTYKPKSQSQIIRNVIYRLWEKTDQKRNFETYYTLVTNGIINKLKSKLNDAQN